MSASTALPPRRLSMVPLADVVLAVGLCSFAVLEVGLARPERLWPDAAIVACATLPLTVRRFAPLGSVAGIVAALLLLAATGGRNSAYVSPLVAVLVALYSLGAYAAPLPRLLGVAAAAGAAVTSALAESGHGLSDALFAAGAVALPWTVGVVSHRREHATTALREHAERLEREQAEREQAVIAAERQRIARELHDIVAHAVTLMVVQANAGERQVRSDPDAAERAFGVIRASGKTALGDLRRMLDLLRSHPGDLETEPQPAETTVDQLVESARHAGASVLLEAEALDGVPDSVVVAVRRLVQEALTNATRHAHGAPVSVRLLRQPDALRLTVRNEAGSPIGETAGGGYGLIGMRERVTVFGGSFSARREPDGAFTLDILLPVGSGS